MTTGQLRHLLERALARWNEDGASRLAASMAFYAILSLAPLLIFGIALAGQFLDSGTVRQQVLDQARDQLGRGASDLLTTVIESASRPSATVMATIISLVLALFGASGLFDQLNLSVNSIWKSSPRPMGMIRGFLVAKALSVLMALTFVALILSWMLLDSVMGYVRGHTGGMPGWPAISFAVSVAFLTLVFAIAFISLPRVKLKWSDVWLAAGLTATGFALLKYLLSLYFGYSKVGAAYGPAGALVILLLWFYYSAQIFFFGVEVSNVYSHTHGSLKDRPADDLQIS